MNTEISTETVNHKVGDIVTIANNMFGNKFKIGEKVTIVKIDSDYRCKGEGDYWHCLDGNFEPKKQLDFLDISDLCDTCLQKERAALDLGNNEDAEFYSKIWQILITEMQKR